MPLTTFGPRNRPLDLPAGDRLIISVPASTANLGPAMDGLGMSVGVRLTVTIAGEARELEHEGTAYLRDFLASSGVAVADWAGVTSNDIPVERGLGGSAAVRLAGLLAVAAVLGDEPDTDRLLADAAALEGHPDNAAAALCGGVVASASFPGTSRVAYVELGALTGLTLALAIPDQRVSTMEARRILPDAIAHADARFTASHVAVLVAALAERRFELLDGATRDRLHQPYRLPLIAGAAEALDGARAAGALAAFLSGSGSTLAAIAEADRAGAVAAEMVQRLGEHGTKADPMVVGLDGRGAEATVTDAAGSEVWGWRWEAPVRTGPVQAD